jgi:hypothetical protein
LINISYQCLSWVMFFYSIFIITCRFEDNHARTKICGVWYVPHIVLVYLWFKVKEPAEYWVYLLILQRSSDKWSSCSFQQLLAMTWKFR